MTARAGGGRSRRAGMSVLAGAAAAVLALSGCGVLGEGAEESSSTASPTGADADSPEASGDRTIPPQLLECGQDQPGDDELQLADVDLSTATWAMPDGFEESFSYVEDNPVEDIATTWYAVPTDPELPSLNVLNVVVYTGLDWGDLADSCGRVPLEAVKEQLGRYREQIGAETLDEAQMTEVAGMPAITQRIGLSEYSYLGYWLFSETQLLHVYCQWTDESAREVIEPACGPLVESVSVG